MSMSPEVQRLRDQHFRRMLEATFPLQPGADQEVNLRALIEATEMLRDRFERELEELRQEAAE